MIPYSGDFAEDATVYLMFNTFTSNDPSASSTITDFINTDVHIHKDDGLTQRNNAAGITVSKDFDTITGSHQIKIDTSDDTVAGFWVVGHDYFVRIEGATVDAGTINAVVGHFSIENRFAEVDVVKWLSQAVTLSTGNKPDVNVDELKDSAQDATDLGDFASDGYDSATHKVTEVATLTGHTAQSANNNTILAHADYGLAKLVRSATPANALGVTVSGEAEADLTHIHGSALTETVVGYLAAAFIKLFDVVTPVLVASDVMRGTDSAALAATALSDAVWTNAKAAFLDAAITGRAPASEYDTEMGRITADVATEAKQDTNATHLLDIKGTGFVKDTDSLPQCLTATGFSTHDAVAVKTAMEADGGDLSSLMEALVNKLIITEADGAAELHNDAGASQGSVAGAFTSIAGFTTRERIFK